MEIRNFINKDKYISYKQLKDELEKYKLKINIDKNNNYYMISETNESDFTNKFIRQCTGIILDKDTNNILHYFGEKAYDIHNNYNNNKINLEDINFNECYVSPYIEGYIVKVFNYKGKWKFATSKHTNIKYFKIENKTLYNIFKNCILETFNKTHDFLNLLNDNYCYTFVLNNNNYYIFGLNIIFPEGKIKF